MTAVSLTEWEDAAAVKVVALAWGGDPVDIGAVVAAEPNQTEEAAEPNRTEGVVAPFVVVTAGVGVGGEAGVGEGVALGILRENVLAAVLT